MVQFTIFQQYVFVIFLAQIFSKQLCYSKTDMLFENFNLFIYIIKWNINIFMGI